LGTISLSPWQRFELTTDPFRATLTCPVSNVNLF
jgi:hypothetical protein